MAEAFPAAARAFEEADDTLGLPLSRIMWEGPDEELVETRNAQPAILTHSVAVLRALGGDLPEAGMAAGHSLGEFSAHVAVGTLPFATALKAVRLRGELMYQAGRERAGTMAAVLGLDDDVVEEICQAVSRPGSIVVTANLNSPGQVVISGDVHAVERAEEQLREVGARRVVGLSVSGAFHSPLMEPAQEGLRRELEDTRFDRPRVPVISNVTAAPVRHGDEARDLLVEQLTAPVRWSQSVGTMVELGAERFVELGPGSVLTGLNRRNARGVPSQAVGEPGDFESLDL